MKNNLFYYASSELSQDAFICYLMSFALEDARDDPVLRECALSVLTAMVPELEGKAPRLTEVKHQENYIDVLLTAVCKGRTYKIIVEDKTYTSEHSNQLVRYLEETRGMYPDCEPRGVYYKTGFQSRLSAVAEAGYQIIPRSRMLELLAPCAAKTHNQIILDYFEYWDAFEREAQSYRSVPLSQWGWRQIYGFYDALQNSDFPREKQIGVKYEHVANRSGGFENLCAWVYDNIVTVRGTPCELYMQIEAAWRDGRYHFPICLKLKPMDENVSVKDVRNALIFDEGWNYRLTDYQFRRPGRLAVGAHMTVGIYDAAYETAAQLKDAFSAAIDSYARLVSSLRT